MNIVEKIFNDDEIRGKYQAIDRINPYPFSHGMRHVENVLTLASKLKDEFSLSEREVEILKVCEILHDLGQVDGRENHGLKAANFAKGYLPKFNYFTEKELEEIYSAITTHDEKDDFSKLENKFSWLVNFIDKMDFSRKRLEDNCREKFGYIEYEDIEDIDFKVENGKLKILLRLINNPLIISEERLFNHSFFNKALMTAKKFASHFNLDLEVYLGDKKLNLNNISLNKITS